MVPSVPASVLIPVVVVASLIPLAGFLTAGLGGRAAGVEHWARLGLWVAVGLLLWGALDCGLDALKIGWGKPYRLTPLFLAMAWALTQVVAVLGVRHSPRLRAALTHRSGLWRLTSIQVARSLGLVFLILLGQHKLPGLFAYPAAWGDVAVGVAAPVAMWATWFRYEELFRPGSSWRRFFIGFNLIGLADHVNAVFLGTGAFPHMFFGVHPTTAIFAGLPMVLFPIFMVPFADLAHLICLDVIRQPSAALRPSRRRVPALTRG